MTDTEQNEIDEARHTLAIGLGVTCRNKSLDTLCRIALARIAAMDAARVSSKDSRPRVKTVVEDRD
jgi:hypothetical protein